MKTLPAALAAHYATRWHTLALCLKVTRTDSAVRAYTSYDQPITFAGVTYSPGFNLSSLASSNTLSVDNMQLTVLPEGDSVLDTDLFAGKWDNADFELFELNYLALTDSTQFNLLKRGNLGELTFKAVHYEVEFRSLSQALQQTQGIVTQKTCRARLGDAKCTKDLGAFTFTGTIDSSTDRRNFVDAARTEADNYFAEGTIEITSGDNAGIFGKVKSNTASAFVLSLPMPFDIAVGNTYTIVAGCMKRLAEDCVIKFANAVNFQGEPHMPGLDALTRPGAAQAQAASTPTLPAESGADGAGSDPDGGE